VNTIYLLLIVSLESHTSEKGELILGEHLTFYSRLNHPLCGDDFSLEEWRNIQSTLGLGCGKCDKPHNDDNQNFFHIALISE
jgi:hypothetical protein